MPFVFILFSLTLKYPIIVVLIISNFTVLLCNIYYTNSLCSVSSFFFFFFAEERYDFAKKLKQAMQDLQKVGEKLGKFDVEKRQAVESEDYDKAKLKKIQMDEYRLQVYKQLEIHDLLELQGVSRGVVSGGNV